MKQRILFFFKVETHCIFFKYNETYNTIFGHMCTCVFNQGGHSAKSSPAHWNSYIQCLCPGFKSKLSPDSSSFQAGRQQTLGDSKRWSRQLVRSLLIMWETKTEFPAWPALAVCRDWRWSHWLETPFSLSPPTLCHSFLNTKTSMFSSCYLIFESLVCKVSIF